jgi:hypothetical protein
MKQIVLSLLLLLCLPIFANCQDENIAENTTTAYINKYKQLAMQEQIRVGIPAAITLAQGIHESASGTSELATKAKNHFGIKCKNNWTGETFLHDDDALQECFRKYPADVASYEDHSNYLKNNRRYSFLFDIPLRNYADWAVGLRKAGYATNPKYSSRLVELIKKHGLDVYTEEAIKKAEKQIEELANKETQEDQQKIEQEQLEKTKKKLARKKNNDADLDTKVKQEDAATTITEEVEGFAQRAKKIMTNADAEEELMNGLHGFYAKKGELLLKEAVSRNIKYTKLLSLNDLSEAPLPADMFIYTEKKFKKSPLKRIHIVAQDETMLTIAQAEGMQLYSLLELNMMEENEEPVVGSKIFLQNTVIRKPQLRKSATVSIEVPVKKETVATKSEEVNIANNVFTKQEIVQLKENIDTEPIQVAVIKKATTTTITPADIAASQAELANEITSNSIEQAKLDVEAKEKEVAALKEQQIAEAKIRALQVASQQEAEKKVQEAAQQAAVALVESEKVIPVKMIKSPSNYKEADVSEELHRMKKVMDEIVYAAPPVKKIKVIVPAVVPAPTNPAKVVPTAKPKTVPIIPAKNPAKPTSKTTSPVVDKTIGPKLPAENQATVKPKTAAIVNADKKNTVKPKLLLDKAKAVEAKKDAIKKEVKVVEKKVTDKKVADKKTNTKPKNPKQ